jgi:hypothetical protein
LKSLISQKPKLAQTIEIILNDILQKMSDYRNTSEGEIDDILNILK